VLENSHNKDEFVAKRLSRSGLRKGLPISLDRKRSIRILSDSKALEYGQPEDSSISIANFRHQGSWWVAHLPDRQVIRVEVIPEIFRLGPLRLAHRYLKFIFAPGQRVKLIGQENKNFGDVTYCDDIVFSPEGVAEDHRILLWKSMIPYYMIAYCFRSGEYVEDRRIRQKIAMEFHSVNMSHEKKQDLLIRCLNKSHHSRESELGNFFHNNCATGVYEQLCRVTDKPFSERGIRQYFQNISHHCLSEKSILKNYGLDSFDTDISTTSEAFVNHP